MNASGFINHIIIKIIHNTNLVSRNCTILHHRIFAIYATSLL